mgnify:CR=1 FL=1
MINCFTEASDFFLSYSVNNSAVNVCIFPASSNPLLDNSEASLPTAFVSILALSEGYVAIILNGQMFSKAYDNMSVKRRVLSRSLEEGITLTAGLIPWSVAGAFYAGTLGVPVLDYALYALLNWLNPLVAIIFAYLGIGLFRTKSAQPEDS